MSSTTLDIGVGKLAQVIYRTNVLNYTTELNFNLAIPDNLHLLEVLLVGGGGGGQGSAGVGSAGTASTIKYLAGALNDGEYAAGGRGGGQDGGGFAAGGPIFTWDDIDGMYFQPGIAGYTNTPARLTMIGAAGYGGTPYADKIGGGAGGILHRFFKPSDLGGLTSIPIVIGRGGVPSASLAGPGNGGACIIKIYTK